jgi:hypothetical protein
VQSENCRMKNCVNIGLEGGDKCSGHQDLLTSHLSTFICMVYLKANVYDTKLRQCWTTACSEIKSQKIHTVLIDWLNRLPVCVGVNDARIENVL